MLNKLLEFFSHKKNTVLEATIYSILNKLLDIAPPILIGLAVDTVVKREHSFLASYGITDHFTQMIYLGALTFVIWTFESLFEFLLKIRWRGLAQEIQHSLRMETYAHLQKLEMSFFEDASTGNLTTIINDDVNQLERFLDVGANEIIQVFTTAIAIGGIFFYISPTIASLSFIPIPIILWGSFYFQKKIAPRYLKVRNEAGFLSSILMNNLSGIATIKSYVAEKFEYNRLNNQSKRYIEENEKAILISSSFSPLIRMAILCAFMIVLVLGGFYVFEGKLEVGPYSVMIFLIQRLLWPLTRLGDVFDLYQRAKASTERIFNLLKTEIKLDSGKAIIGKDHFKGTVKFNNVSFKYNTGAQVLNTINLEVKEHKTIALVGTTGSGKSTILKLILRFYDATEGIIEIDGKNIKEYDERSLRENIGFVSQDTYLFHGTIKENILYGSFDKTMDEVVEAAKFAEAHNFIMSFEKGYDTIVGERGQKLSGGQRQRISIARAIIKKPKLFIFDEATSAVDNETEASIQRSLKEITKTTSTIMVAHRLSTIKHADIIYVLENGKIIEEGSHDELLKKEGAYSALWKVQTGALNS